MAANSKNVLLPFVLDSASLATSFTTAPTNIQYLDNVAVQINITTSNAMGSFVVEGSLDYNRVVPTNAVVNAGNWVAIDLPFGAVVSGSSNVILIDMNQLSFPWIRVRYIATSGTGTASIYISAKAV